MRWWMQLTLAVVLALPGLLSAQPERFELGQRLRAFEAAWEEMPPEAAARQRALPHLNRAVTTFFAINPSGAGAALDQARHALRSKDGPPTEVLWAESLYLRPECRFVDAAAPELRVTLARFYSTPATPPQEARLRIRLEKADGTLLAPAHEMEIKEMPTDIALKQRELPEGDHTVRVEIVTGGKTQVSATFTISCVRERAARLRKLQAAVADWPRTPLSTERETVRSQARLLEQLAAQESRETNYPAARLLKEAEDAVAQLAAGKRPYGQKTAGEFWLTLVADQTPVPVRVLAPPEAAKGEPLPLVIALHGMGGTENVFFEGYGRGAVVRLCQKRGWLLVAPRVTATGATPALADVVAALDRLYPVDKKRVFLVGHSLGGMRAVAAAGQTPDRFAAVAVLGGGGSVKPSERLKELPFFVGSGSDDFAHAWARTLEKELAKAAVKTVQYKEYASVEHLAIVGVALPDVFAFFDAAANE